MPVERELTSIRPARPTLVTVGVFDGVHLGHRALLGELVRQAAEKELLSCVITFRQHPLQVLRPRETPPSIASLSENIRLIKACGVHITGILSFDAELAGINAQTFVLLLQRYLRMRGLALGWDFAMGRQREGNIAALEGLGRELGFTTCVVPPVKLGGEIISSTAIRVALGNGDIARANAMLGRCFSREGRVISGDGRGSRLGFPTANLDTDPQLVLPARGVYATTAWLEGRSFASVTNIGTKPTFEGSEVSFEVHLLDFSGDIYRKTLSIDFVDRLRDEQRFDGTASLQAQITRDIITARGMLRSDRT